MSHLHSVNFPAYEEISKQFHISAAVCIPTGCRLVATSGHVGMDDNGDVKVDLREQIECSFQNVEKAIRACDPQLSTEEIWNSVYQVTTYHAGGVGEEVMLTLQSVARKYMGHHRPAWAAIGVETLVIGKFEMSVFAALPGRIELS
ncbi:hypothetical protein PV08_05754 [Exophiala spinifera]|uniref:Uncharacterized protein n=1 Tax=Exophiala spinifera TaxID=91928 RepID=A0A0D2BWN7_9EURO|nr:uncharacterized protein PV08_05754 [Exophiala spinifera]KIW15704.1 hypothetical protein PV08_05754 [Exophiala spinifera]